MSGDGRRNRKEPGRGRRRDERTGRREGKWEKIKIKGATDKA